MSTQTGTYFIGTFGEPIAIRMSTDLTGATAVNLTIYKPGGDIVNRNLGLPSITDYATGLVTFAPTSAEVDEPNVYTFSLRVDIGASKRVTTEGTLKIAPSLRGSVTLVAEDGTVVDDANSYVTLAEAEAYNASSLYSDAWNNATTADKERSLMMATRVIDMMFAFDGSRTDSTQALAWPRVYVPNRELDQPWMYPSQILQGMIAFGPGILYGAFWPSDMIPPPIKAATCELARYLLKGDRTADDPSKGISSLSLGSGAFAVTFNAADRKDVLPDIVVAALAPFGSQRGSKEGFKPVFRT